LEKPDVWIIIAPIIGHKAVASFHAGLLQQPLPAHQAQSTRSRVAFCSPEILNNGMARSPMKYCMMIIEHLLAFFPEVAHAR
jgi:hypothetical protein